MTYMGRRSGDMFKADYDANDNTVVDNSEKLAGSTKTQVQNHTPKAHAHVEGDILDLSHNAVAIAGKEVNDAAIGDQKTLAYDTASGKIIYITPAPSGVVLESIQVGTILIEDEAGNNTATINSVDITKAVVYSLGFNASQDSARFFLTLLTLDNATTVKAVRYEGSGGFWSKASFCVIEFSSGIVGVQSGNISIGGAETFHDATITEVDVDKTLLLPRGCYDSDYGTAMGGLVPYLELINSTTVRATQGNAAYQVTAGFSLIEFV